MLNKVSISDHIIIIVDVYHLNENNILGGSLYFFRPTTRKEFCEDKGIEIIAMFTVKRLCLTYLLFVLGAGNILLIWFIKVFFCALSSLLYICFVLHAIWRALSRIYSFCTSIDTLF